MKEFLLGVLLITAVNGQASDSESSNQEPRCNSKFDNDFKLLEKLAKLEESQETLLLNLNNQKDIINELQDKLRVSLLPHWGDWSAWSDCYLNCTGRNGGRVQSRSRETIAHSSTHAPQKETEERPCNAVQFAGCIKSYGADDNFGVTYDFADQIAVSTCTALLPGGSNHVYAVRRTCSDLAVSCADTCKRVKTKCFNALHVYRGSPLLKRNQNGAKGLYLYRYNSCAGNFCGPNFCCCHA
ncbi:uncharacterized protein LOC123547182 isoform X2 [Mercenaria mercenaria]|uniref:uncharacterized protein LOC123547182 isoform X1 n=1 Tax=Mercenaria mercenaria TaxID=6596 RepID=UPI00234F6B22|nr:uncharacterized protein LOC123547182 isoform X1 [Mercenaria mercenaria]XP_053407389.1 uncharacterized protein LOC123547182 isoform X2 [Mercenaria mercenaria]